MSVLSLTTYISTLIHTLYGIWTVFELNTAKGSTILRILIGSWI